MLRVLNRLIPLLLLVIAVVPTTTTRLRSTSVSSPVPLSAFFSTVTTTFLHQSNQEVQITTGYLSVQFDRDVHVSREYVENPDSSILSNAEAYPEVDETMYGLARLVCKKDGGSIIFSTDHKVPIVTTSPVAVGVLYPFAEIQQHAASWLVSAIAHDKFDTSRYTLSSQVISSKSRYDAVYLWTNNSSSGKSNTLHPDEIVSLVQKGDCNIEFLNRSQQTWTPPGALSSIQGTEFYGSLVVRYWNADDPSAIAWPRRELCGSSTQKTTNNVMIITNAITRVSKLQQEEQQQQQQQQPSQSQQQPESKDSCIPLPPGLADYADKSIFLESSSSSTSTSTSHAQLTGIAQELPKLIKEPVSDILKPITKLMGGFLGETLIEPFKEQMGQMTSAGMTAGTVEELSSAMINSLSKGIPATTLETIPFVVTEGLAESLKLYVTEQVTNELVGPLSSKLAASLGSTVPKKVDGDVPKKLASHVTKSLIHSLTRSVSHAMVPALVHTLTHSPLQDYYCYYCFHHKTYCQYCQYSPSQLYYTLYYTGFYSTYYGDYFADT